MLVLKHVLLDLAKKHPGDNIKVFDSNGSETLTPVIAKSSFNSEFISYRQNWPVWDYDFNDQTHQWEIGLIAPKDYHKYDIQECAKCDNPATHITLSKNRTKMYLCESCVRMIKAVNKDVK